MANLRILYENTTDDATLSVSSQTGALGAANLLTDIKTEVWRATSAAANITATWPAGKFINMVALPFCSLSPSATIRVQCFTLSTDVSPVLDTGAVLAGGAEPLRFGALPVGVNAYSYGGGSYGTVYFSKVVAQKVVISLNDASNALGYVECSRLVTGTYWSPETNADYGVEVVSEDTSKHERSDAGNLTTERGIIYKTMSLDLGMMPSADRDTAWRIVRGNGKFRPLFLSLSPDSADTGEEQIFQIYGKLGNSGAMRYQFHNQYNTKLQIEEI